ncbi:MAG TPA: AbrB/MazE/SpoVT family DNA-binding domain-containing protein [Candidatus Lokiarchaeia archaeon]|nr:AbrB/MazE/SpoVT family DNA-binding domain-containing protein [Candidatus Lokiarchaeia archaeon]
MSHNHRSISRKIITVGRNSLAIILPKEWVDACQIEKGSEILLHQLRSGQILLQKSPISRYKVELEAGQFDQDILDATIQSAYFLNIDEIVLKFPEMANLPEQIDHVGGISKKFPGMNLAITGPHEVTLNSLTNMSQLKIHDIFNQMLAILWLLLDHIKESGSEYDNTFQLFQMESEYSLGVRMLVSALRNYPLVEFEEGTINIIQVLGSRIALRALRSLILQVKNFTPYLKAAEIPDLQVLLGDFHSMVQIAIQCLFEPSFALLQQLSEYWANLEHSADEIQDASGTMHSFIGNVLDIIQTFKEVSITRYVEWLEANPPGGKTLELEEKCLDSFTPE